MFEQAIESQLSKINLKANRVHVPLDHSESDLITILYEKLGTDNIREVWKLEFLDNHQDLLLKQEFNELYYLNTHNFLIINNQNVLKYRIANKCEMTNIIEIPKGDYNRFDIVTNSSGQFLFHLSKSQIQVKDENSTEEKSSTANQYTLTTYNTDTLQVVNEVKFQASVRTLMLVPICQTICFMMNPNSATNKNVQFIIYDESQPKSKTIQVKETQRELRGTIVKVLSYQNQLIFIYNSNSVDHQFITFYCLDNGNEMNHAINIGQQYQIRDAEIKGDRILFTCFNQCLFDEFTFLFDISDKSVRMISSGECNYLYGRNVIVQHNKDCVILILMANPNLMMTHFFDKIPYDLSIRQELAEL